MKDLIEVKNISKRYGNSLALDQVSFTVRKGEILGILGPNGSGKTTLLKILLGLIEFDGGSVVVNGDEVTQNPEKIRRLMGIVVEDQGAYGQMTVHKYLTFFSQLYGIKKMGQKMEKLLDSLGLSPYLKTEIAKLSKGNRQKVAIARAVVHDPEVVLLDEPTDNLDPETKEVVLKYIQEMTKEGKTIVLCSHNLREVERVADRCIVIRYGVVLEELHLKKEQAEQNQFVIGFVGDPSNVDQLLQSNFAGQVEEKEEGRFEIKCTVSSLDELRSILEQLLRNGLNIYEVHKLQSTLEDMYFQTVQGVVS